ncbi:hypothetical protein Vadar_005076 [Vaccinium darrowii]|uniref:Uncharacterized protein n=1 Tax=Vaccinium darrowii TaxID=229202 RepID=A0ACB7XFU6_9ERIC|nr:hypothetical protein Vadar_005076 [Vaccinium darrowii]
MSEMSQPDPEGLDGIRTTRNAWPRTKVEANKCVIPLAASISLIRPYPDIPTLPYAPFICKTCSRVDFTALLWTCPFCHQRDHFPRHYSSIWTQN